LNNVQELKVSIVVPCFNENESVANFYNRLWPILESVNAYNFEIIFVDDCSTDGTLDLLKQISPSSKIDVRIFQNSRNYGVYRSTFRVLRECTGDLIIPMLPIDLQDPPELIPTMLRLIRDGRDVVAGRRFERSENLVMKTIRRSYYRFVTKFAYFAVPAHVGEFQLITRQTLEQFKHSDDYYPYIRGMIANATSNVEFIDYEWAKREAGTSKHNLIKLYDQAVNGIVSTSKAPLRFLVLLGSLLSTLCFGVALLQLVAFFSFAHNKFTTGMPTLVTGIFFFFGITFIFLGIIGEYIGAIHAQLRLNNAINTNEVTLNEES